MRSISASATGENITFINSEDKKRFFSFSGDIPSPKVLFKGYLPATPYDHNLGYFPLSYQFNTDDVANPTYFTAERVFGDTNALSIPDVTYYTVIFIQ